MGGSQILSKAKSYEVVYILESKRDLADAVVGQGEAWITELDDGELRELFSLGGGVTIDDADNSEAA